ncbi:hypothetical protein [Photorhabdus khanii]|uniref:hypothetical protein n=1 Tax=Photorhabdus khanii TaxID=1004150 RepID=UPI00056527F3
MSRSVSSVLPADLVAVGIGETQLAAMLVPFTQTGVAVRIFVAVRQAKFIPQDSGAGHFLYCTPLDCVSRWRQVGC